MITNRAYSVGERVAYEFDFDTGGYEREGACEAIVQSCEPTSSSGSFNVKVTPVDTALAKAMAEKGHGRIQPLEALPAMLMYYTLLALHRAQQREWKIREMALLDALAAVGRGIGGVR